MASITGIIARKRDGRQLTADELQSVVGGFVRGEVSQGQMGALLMAILLRGMTPRETADLTLAMLASGDRLDLSSIPGIKVDKHSTGGVGDKTTLVVGPLVAALGVPVPKMSGRALGHTGGTIDKLESIPGLTTDLSPERFCRQVADIGIAVASQTDSMVPADKMIYALRDATATVESIPLIASSVMSKKLAAGADVIVLDVKAGLGAFMPDTDSGRQLAQAMVDIGTHAGKKTVALITRMDEPIGRAIGDGPELAEAIATLAGHGPADFVALCEAVGGHMLVLGGVSRNPDEGSARIRRGLASGLGLSKLREMVVAQGGSPGVVDDPSLLTRDAQEHAITAEGEGWVAALNSRRIGAAVRDLKLAAGPLKHACGVLLHKKTGDPVRCGDVVARVLAPAPEDDVLQQTAREVRAAFHIGAEPARLPGPVAFVVTSD